LKLIKKIFSLLTNKEKQRFVLLQLLLITNLFLEMLGLGLIVPIISLFTDPISVNNIAIIRSISTFFTISDSEKLLKYLVIILVVTYTIKGFLQYYLLVKQAKFSKELSKNLAFRLYEKYLLQPYNKYLSQNTAVLVRNIENEATTFSSTLDYFFLFQTNLVLILAIISMVVYNDPIIGGVILLFFSIIGSLFFLLTKKRIKIWSLKRQSEQTFRMQFLFEGLNSFKDVKILGRETYFINKFKMKGISFTRSTKDLFRSINDLWYRYCFWHFIFEW